MNPWLDDGSAVLYHGDCLDVLRDMSNNSVNVVATSPPFYGLRDYGSAGQIGLEENPYLYIERLAKVFDEIRRVLAEDGTLWVEIGDSFRGKNLVGIPWMLAFALQERGWYLRSEIIWVKPNPMPESVKDRPTRAHSTIFLFAKNSKYFYDSDAIREPYKKDGRKKTTVIGREGSIQKRNGERWPNPIGANARTVWNVAAEPTPFAHFATWPQKLVARMVLAGSRPGDTVLDPFCGSGTTVKVARDNGRKGIGIELNEDYLKIAKDRLRQLSLVPNGDHAISE